MNKAFQQERSRLVTGARDTIRSAISAALRQAKGTVQEPDFVAAMLSATPQLAGRWGRALAPHNIAVKVAAVFCHQSPRVRFDGMRKNYVELGDLLFVFVHKPLQGEERRTSLLVQAKKSAHEPHPIGLDEMDQLNLYRHWKEFRYVRSGKLTKKTRHVYPKKPHAGAQYLLIHTNGTRTQYTMDVCVPKKNLTADAKLHIALYDMLIGNAGRAFAGRNAAMNDRGWTRVIWDLLDVTASSRFTRRRVRAISVRRGVVVEFCEAMAPEGTVCLWSIGAEAGEEDVPPDLPAPSNEGGKDMPDDGVGIPTIIVETTERDNVRQAYKHPPNAKPTRIE